MGLGQLLLVLVAGRALASPPSVNEAIDFNRVMAAIRGGNTRSVTTEMQALQALLASPGDEDGKKGIAAFVDHVQQVNNSVRTGGSEVRALWRILGSSPKSPSRDAFGGRDSRFNPEAVPQSEVNAWRLFGKAVFPRFMELRPDSFMLEDTLAAFADTRVAYGREAGKDSEYFATERRRLIDYWVRHPENAEEFQTLLARQQGRSASGGADWTEGWPRDKMGRIDRLADLFLANRGLFSRPEALRQALIAAEEVNQSDGKNKFSIDKEDLMMRMTEKVEQRLRANPEDTAAREHVEALVRVASTGIARRSGGQADGIIDAVMEQVRRDSAGSWKEKVYQDNDLRHAKSVILLDRLHSMTPDASDRQALREVAEVHAAVGGTTPLAREGCLTAYREVSSAGFYNRSVPTRAQAN